MSNRMFIVILNAVFVMSLAAACAWAGPSEEQVVDDTPNAAELLLPEETSFDEALDAFAIPPAGARRASLAYCDGGSKQTIYSSCGTCTSARRRFRIQEEHCFIEPGRTCYCYWETISQGCTSC